MPYPLRSLPVIRTKKWTRANLPTIKPADTADEASRADAAVTRFATLDREARRILSDVRTLVIVPLVFDARVESVARFHSDYFAARDMLSLRAGVENLEDVEAASLSAQLSWRVALECCTIKAQRRVHHDGTRLSPANDRRWANIYRGLHYGAPAEDIVKAMASIGFAVRDCI